MRYRNSVVNAKAVMHKSKLFGVLPIWSLRHVVAWDENGIPTMLQAILDVEPYEIFSEEIKNIRRVTVDEFSAFINGFDDFETRKIAVKWFNEALPERHGVY